MNTHPLFWCDKPSTPNQHVAFRGTWEMSVAAEVTFRFLGASRFVVWIEGERCAEGPARFHQAYPEYQEKKLRLAGGRHVIAVLVIGYGYETRMLSAMEPFLYMQVFAGENEFPVKWNCSELEAFFYDVRRINPQLGAMEWCDTRRLPDWQSPAFDDSAWAAPVKVDRKLGKFGPLSSGDIGEDVLTPTLMAEGSLVETFGYETDNPAARFFLRELGSSPMPSQGAWRRYDLGRVRLMRPCFRLDLPPGTVVEFAYAEDLRNGRVAPWINLSAGDSCHLDHFIARGGVQEFSLLAPRGGRFLEVHVLAPPDEVRFLDEKIIERAYHDEVEGAFQSGDPLLDRIWLAGVETHRACSEDALTDNPTRERGQWSGDVVTGLDICASAFSDLRLCRRAILQFAQSAREDGLVSGLCPGGGAYLSTYAAQWITACLHYWRLTGDLDLLKEMYEYAERNVAAFEAKNSPDGLQDDLGWAFVDWGYVRNSGPSDMGLNLHYFAALNDMATWSGVLNRPDRAGYFRGLAEKLGTTIRRYFRESFSGEGDPWKRIGYHRTVLGLRLGFFDQQQNAACIAAIKKHLLDCFPNDLDAPRLSDPGANNPRLITPYFAHYTMPLLIEQGEMDFVLEQFRTCWGWALSEGRTTLLEVFDTRWSHCHQWAGAPTWQLSRYVLGLSQRYDLGERHFDLRLVPGSLAKVSGRIPLPGDANSIEVSWQLEHDKIRYQLKTPMPITVHFPDGSIQPVESEAAWDL